VVLTFIMDVLQIEKLGIDTMRGEMKCIESKPRKCRKKKKQILDGFILQDKPSFQMQASVK